MKHLRNQQGAAMVELAIALPLFLALLLAVVDFGLYFNKRIVLQAAAYNYTNEAAANDCKAPNRTIIDDTVKNIISDSKTTVSFTGEAIDSGATHALPPTARYRVQLTYKGKNTLLSAFTKNLPGLYPMTAIGISHCSN